MFKRFRRSIKRGNVIRQRYHKADTSQAALPAGHPYAAHRESGMKERQSYQMTLNRASFISMHALNKIKEFELKAKVRRGEKVRVAFVVDRIASFKTGTLYRAMERSDIFEPFVLLYSIFEHRLGNDKEWENYRKAREALTQSGYQVCCGYDENRQFIDPDFFSPDIVVISALYYDLHNFCYTSTDFNLKYLVCAFNYGFSLYRQNYNYYFNNPAMTLAWIHFLESRFDYHEQRHYSRDYGANSIFLGAPFLDYYGQNPSGGGHSLPQFDNGNPIVIYAPHWSWRLSEETASGKKQGGPGLGTFNLYYDHFLELVTSTPDVNFIFRPHPSLAYNLEMTGIMSPEDYQTYLEKLNSLPNSCVYEGGEYIELFKKSSLLITDSASFLVEYLPSGHPCICMMPPGEDSEHFLEAFSLLGRNVLSAYYLCSGWEKLLRIFKKLIYRHWDPLKDARHKLIDQIFVNLGNAGIKIEQYLQKKLQS